MSSLAAARADNFYFPPEWRPEYGGISKFAGSKGANQYEQYGIIRFELPFDGWCTKCHKHLSKGLRFNAKKDKAGKYFSTQIYSFTMKCYDCLNVIIIETDPQNSTYNFKEGIRKHEQEFEPDFDDGIILATSDETRQLIVSDPMFKLQHQNEDFRKAQTESERFDSIVGIQEANFKNDYNTNSLLRTKNRVKRKRDKELDKESYKKGLSIKLLEHSTDDLAAAKLIKFAPKITAKASENDKMSALRSESIFSSHAPTNTAVSATTKKGKGTTVNAVIVRPTSSSSGASIKSVKSSAAVMSNSSKGVSHKSRGISSSSSGGGGNIQRLVQKALLAKNSSTSAPTNYSAVLSRKV